MHWTFCEYTNDMYDILHGKMLNWTNNKNIYKNVQMTSEHDNNNSNYKKNKDARMTW